MKKLLITLILILFSGLASAIGIMDYKDEILCANELNDITRTFSDTKFFYLKQMEKGGGLDSILAVTIYHDFKQNISQDLGIFVLTNHGLYYFDLELFEKIKAERRIAPVIYLNIPGHTDPLHIIYLENRIVINGYVYQGEIDQFVKDNSKELDSEFIFSYINNKKSEIILNPSTNASQENFNNSMENAILDEIQKAEKIYYSEKNSTNSQLVRYFSNKSEKKFIDTLEKCRNVKNNNVLNAVRTILPL